jgi:putative hydrolase
MSDPFSFGSSGGFDPRMFEHVPLFKELWKVLSWSGGPVNWDLAAQTATGIAASEDRQDATAIEQATGPVARALADAVAAAELWLDAVTSLPAVDGPVRAFSVTEWINEAASSGGLGVYVEPVAKGMGSALSQQLPEQMAGMAEQMEQVMGQMGAMLYGVQTGTVAGHLAGQLLGTYDLGVPTVDPRTVGTVGDNAERFADDHEFDRTEFRYWLALAETAQRRQFAGVPWLSDHLAGLIGEFASEADFDPNAMLEQLSSMGLDPNDPTAMAEALQSEDAFQIEPSSAQREVLERLQALVAFLHSWTDVVVRAAASDKLTSLPSIEEAIRRRRAESGPGERFLAQLIGLDLTPSDYQQSQEFCEAVIAARGQEGLDRVWADPSYLPRSDELAEPSLWLVRMAAAELEHDLGPPPSDPTQ